MTKQPLVYIIILNWNGWRDTVECVESCKKVSYPNHRILLVDNGSTDGSEALLREQFADIEIIQTGQNLGFSGGNNIGMRHAFDNDADYVLLLNNDTIVDPSFVAELVTIAETDRSIGMLCSKIYFYDKPEVIWYAGASFHPWLGWGRHRGHNEHDRGQYDSVETTDRATGCALMASRELCDTIGLLRDEFFVYCEDTDWGMRAQNAGYTIMYVPASKVWHKVSRVLGRASGVSQYYTIRNILACIDANKPLPRVLRSLRHLTVIFISLLGLVTQNIPKAAGVKYLRLGVKHYFQGTFGKLNTENAGRR